MEEQRRGGKARTDSIATRTPAVQGRSVRAHRHCAFALSIRAHDLGAPAHTVLERLPCGRFRLGPSLLLHNTTRYAPSIRVLRL